MRYDLMRKFFTYRTVTKKSSQSIFVGIIYRLSQVIILSYIIFWELLYSRGYQATDYVTSIVTTKVKGHGYVPINRNSHRSNRFVDNHLLNAYDYEVLDPADFIIPPNEFSSVFIMTNFIKTDQKQGACDEELDKAGALCKTDKDCKYLDSTASSWNGLPTGNCIKSQINKSVSVCEIYGWCPTENDNFRKEDKMIRNALNFTIFVKNEVEFKKFNKKERNILPNITNSYISRCIYDEIRDPHCPVFKLDYILNKVETNRVEKNLMLKKGSLISLEIEWNCNYDLFWKQCLPIYSFRRFDNRFQHSTASSGFNFRFAKYFKVNNTQHRELFKAYGLRLIINVSGLAGRFNILPFMLKIGAGFGLLSVSVLLADCMVIKCRKIQRTNANGYNKELIYLKVTSV